MLYINKSQEPNSLTEYRKTNDASYKGLPSNTKDELRESLLKDQGYICAYCMKPIHNVSDTKVEHYIPQKDDNELDYHNLLAVCKGNEGQPWVRQTCDTRKGQTALHINPLIRNDIGTISYQTNGIIKSQNSNYNTDLNKTLNLNDMSGYMINNRYKALLAFKRKFKKAVNPGQSAAPFLQKAKTKFENQKKHTAYVGIILHYIDKKLKQKG